MYGRFPSLSVVRVLLEEVDWESGLTLAKHSVIGKGDLADRTNKGVSVCCCCRCCRRQG